MFQRQSPVNEYEQKQEQPNTTRVFMLLFRLLTIAVFLLLVGRLYQIQITQGSTFREDADDNRFRLVEVPALRGIIYDKTGQILTRNQPSFEISLVPDEVPLDDLDTEFIDEESDEIERVLELVGADKSDIAVRVAELMFRRLGRVDFAEAVESADVELTYVLVPGPVAEPTEEETSQEEPDTPEDLAPSEQVSPILIPDITQPLPIDGLTALVQRSIQLGRQGSASEPVPILDLVDRISAFEIVEDSFRLPGVRVNEVPVREYVHGELVSHIVGFMGPIPAVQADDYRERGYTNPNERVGLNGLEYSYQRELRGLPGFKNLEVDILGREMRSVGQVIEPVPGSNLILNVDLRLQRVMFDELSAMMEERDAPWGISIAMDPQSGAILGMVSLPSYDNNVFAESINEDYLALERDERRPLINYAIGGLYPPGSTFKMVPATAALQENVISSRTTVVDAGPIYLPNRFYPDDLSQAQEFVSWNHDLGIVHGAVNVVQAIALSNDIFFYWIGGGYPPAEFDGLGQRRLAAWAERFGYGQSTGIDLPGEVEALVPDDQWKRQLYAESWTTGDSYNMAIGQGYLLATPLQVLVSSATVANGGSIYQPQIVHQIVDAAGGLQRDFEPKLIDQLPVDEGVLQLVQEGMWAAVNSDFGTAIGARVAGVEVAGKTGTAEFCEYIPEEEDCRRDDEDNLPTHAWFVGYAPYDDPEIAVVTFVYDGGEGSEAAVPVAQKILEAYFQEINPLPE